MDEVVGSFSPVQGEMAITAHVTNLLLCFPPDVDCKGKTEMENPAHNH